MWSKERALRARACPLVELGPHETNRTQTQMAEQMAEIVYSLAEAQAERQWYPTSAAMVAALAPDHPVFCLRAPVLAEAARRFLAAFPGRVLYAVKCNPHPSVLDSLYGAGIRDFDTASLEEIEAVRGRFGDSRAYFHHPVKSRRAIRRAYHDLGVRHFTVDHAAELDKVLTECGGHDLNIQVRFATPPGYAAFDLSAKFGVKPDRAATLLQAVAEAGAAPGLRISWRRLPPVSPPWGSPTIASSCANRGAPLLPMAYPSSCRCSTGKTASCSSTTASSAICPRWCMARRTFPCG